MRVARVLAQAKVNLSLRVFGRLDSGYHKIATIFQRIDLADEITIRVGGSVRALDAAGPRLPEGGLGSPEENLAFRAAAAYAGASGSWVRGFSIELTKNTPVGGGLGGGSADAGAVLRALDALAPRPMARDELLALAASLGADVPFMTTEHAMATAFGRGDQIVPPPPHLPLPPADVLIVVPPFSVSTADAYRWLDDERPHVRTTFDSEKRGYEADLQPGWRGLALAGNDFEPVLERRHPALRDYRERLGQLGASVARLSGSGSCVFGVFEIPAPDARRVAVDALVIPTRTSSRVVQVEVLE